MPPKVSIGFGSDTQDKSCFFTSIPAKKSHMAGNVL